MSQPHLAIMVAGLLFQYGTRKLKGSIQKLSKTIYLPMEGSPRQEIDIDLTSRPLLQIFFACLKEGSVTIMSMSKS